MKRTLLRSFILISSLFIGLTSFAAPLFNANHDDFDPNCSSWNFERFQRVEKYFTVGVDDSKSYGFDFAVPISREQVDAIWCLLEAERGEQNKMCKGLVEFNVNNPFAKYSTQPAINAQQYPQFSNLENQLNTYYAYVANAVKRENIGRPNVGVVLEILARYYLQDLTSTYPDDRYDITGGVEYRLKKGTNTIGELDIIVYDRHSCDVVAIGESKASADSSMSKNLKKAKEQLARFRQFIQKNR